jgi:peptide/nickel transport system substrate-binding protein
MQSRWFRAGVVATLALSMLGGVARAQDAEPSEDGTVVLRVGTNADLATDNPFAVVSGSDWVVVTSQYDMLLKFDSEDLSPAPSLAEGCEPSEDYLTWTCTLREGLLWSDGEPLTSEDVAFSYRFIIDKRIPQYKSYFAFDPVFETPDERTLIWKAEKPTFALDMPPWAYVVPEHVWGQYAAEDVDLKTIKGVPNTPAVTSGPFHLVDWQQGRSWTMERNPNYWGDEPVVDEVQWRYYTNQEAMVTALKNGEVDLIDGIKPSLAGSLEGVENVDLSSTISDWWLNLAFNFGGQGPDADPLPAIHDHVLREAIAMAIDKQEIVEKAYYGSATTGDTIIRPASAFWHLDIPAEEEYAYDPDAANAMLDDAGYVDTNGDGVREDPETGDELVFDVPASEETLGAAEAGQLIVGFLEQIGIQVDLLPVSETKMNDYWGTGNFDAYIWYWSGDPDPNYQLFVFTSEQCAAWSDGCWSNPTFDAYYEEQRGIMDRDQRREVVFAAQQEAYDDIPGVVLAYPSSLQAYRTDRFTDWTPHPGENGYLMPTYNYDSLVSIRPVGETASSAPPTSGLPSWIWIVGAVAVVGIVVLLMRGGRKRADEEA